MAQCKDCIHEKVCSSLIKYGLPWNDEKYPAEKLCFEFLNKADVVPRSEVEKLEKESSAFAEIIHKQEDEIQQLRKSLLTKQALEEEFSKSVKKIEKQALKTIEKAKQEVAREIFKEIEKLAYRFMNDNHYIFPDMVWDIAELKKKYTESEDSI